MGTKIHRKLDRMLKKSGIRKEERKAMISQMDPGINRYGIIPPDPNILFADFLKEEKQDEN